MHDPVFERTVVLVWRHTETEAIGVVVNRALEHRLADIVAIDGELDLSAYDDTPVVWGGPVENTTGTVLTPNGLPDGSDGWVLPNGIGITQNAEALESLIGENRPLVLCLGYAGWGPGQLDQEIEQGSWLFTDCDIDVVFRTPPEDRYDHALATLGLTASTVWMSPIDE